MKSPKPKRISRTASSAGPDFGSLAVRLSVALLVAAASFVAFLPALGNQFVNWDDYENLISNSQYRGLGSAQLLWMFTTFHMGHYQPLSWISFAFDYLIWGMNPFGYHLTNLILHAANAALFFILARLLLLRAIGTAHDGMQVGLTLGAVFAALFFSLHPLRVESVAWATERRDVLSGFFYFASLYAYIQAADATLKRRRTLALSVFLYSLSLLAKGTAMTLAVVLLILDVYPLRRLPGWPSAWLKARYRPILWEKLPYAVLGTGFALLAFLAQQETGALRQVRQYFFSYRLGQTFYGICFYPWKTLVPLNLSPLYELPFDFDVWMPLFYSCGVAVLAVTLLFIYLRRRWPALLTFWLYYVVVLLPVAGVAQSGPQLVADRYSYLSCLSWALLIGGGLSRYWSSFGANRMRKQVLVGLASVILLTLGLMSWQQTRIWHDTPTLWRHVIAVTPRTSLAYYNMGRSYEDDGNLTESLQNYRRALEINPANADAQYNLARLLAKGGMVDEAITGYRRVLAILPKDADAHNNLGQLLARKGNVEAAEREFKSVLKINPRYSKAYFNLGRLFAARGELEPALSSYRKALALDPDQPEIMLAMADALVRSNKLDEAALQLQKIVSLRPDSPEAQTALARLLAAQGRKSDAETHYREALRLLEQRSGKTN